MGNDQTILASAKETVDDNMQGKRERRERGGLERKIMEIRTGSVRGFCLYWNLFPTRKMFTFRIPEDDQCEY